MHIRAKESMARRSSNSILTHPAGWLIQMSKIFSYNHLGVNRSIKYCNSTIRCSNVRIRALTTASTMVSTTMALAHQITMGPSQCLRRSHPWLPMQAYHPVVLAQKPLSSALLPTHADKVSRRWEDIPFHWSRCRKTRRCTTGMNRAWNILCLRYKTLDNPITC